MESSDRERILLFNIKSLESPLGKKKKKKKEKKIYILYLQVFLWTVIIIMRC